MLRRLFILFTLFVFLTGCSSLNRRKRMIEQDTLNQAELINGINDIADSLEQISAKFDEYQHRVKLITQRLDSIEAKIGEVNDTYLVIKKMEEERLLKDIKGDQRWDDVGNEIVSMKSDLAEIMVKLLTLRKDLLSSSKKARPKPVVIPKNKNIP